MSQYARNVHTALVGMIPRTDGLEVDFTGREIVYAPDVILEYVARWPDGREQVGWASIEDGEAYTYEPDEEIIKEGKKILPL